MADIPLQVVSENSSSERRITPAWSISTLKAKLEPVTGIPPSSQLIFLKTSAHETLPVTADDEDSTHLASFPLVAYAELQASHSLPGAVAAFDMVPARPTADRPSRS